MKAERWKQLFESDDEKITKEEWGMGWHWCNEFDGLLVGPTMPEWHNCKCLGTADRSLSEKRCKEAGFTLASTVHDTMGCPPDCGHTQEQHDAFDAGLKAGEDHGFDCKCPYVDESLEDAWKTGQSVGILNRNQSK